jgi:hypothetical protein
MASIFTMLPFSVSNSALPQLAATDYELLVNYEPDAWGYWNFGTSSASLTDLTQGKALTLAGTAPTYNSNGVVIAGGLNSGLVSGLIDGDERTVCAVIKVPSLTSYAGALIAGIISDTQGFAGFITKASSLYSLLPIVRGATGIAQNAATGTVQDEYVFVALSWSNATKTINKFFGGRISASQTSTTSKTNSTSNLAFGNVSYTNASYHSPIEICEGILYDKALSLSEISAVYSRSKNRMAAKGITLF